MEIFCSHPTTLSVKRTRDDDDSSTVDPRYLKSQLSPISLYLKLKPFPLDGRGSHHQSRL